MLLVVPVELALSVLVLKQGKILIPWRGGDDICSKSVQNVACTN